jgi:PAS domain S-box-containing protein
MEQETGRKPMNEAPRTPSEDLQALRDSEQMYRTFIERSSDGVVVLQDRLVKFVNPRFVEMSGYPAETLLGAVFTDYLTPEEIGSLLDRYERRMAGESLPPVYETVMTRKGGIRLPLEISAALISYQGRPADLVLVRDITERKQAESYLRRYRLLADVTPDIILFVGLDGRIMEANRAAAPAYGYDRDELLRLNIRDLRAGPERAAALDLIEKLRHETLRFESVHLRKDGTTFPVEVQTGATTIDNEEMVLGIVRDITERKQAEEALQRALQEAQKHSQRASALQSIAEAGLSLPRLPDLLEAMAETIAKALAVDACCVFVLDEQTAAFEAHAAYNVPGLLGCRVRANEGLIGRVAAEGRPVYVADAEHDPSAYDS